MPRRLTAVMALLAGGALGAGSVGPAGASAPRHARTRPVRVAGPAQFDLTEAQATFRVSPRRHPRVTAVLTGPVGFDYVASAVLRHPFPGAARVLVVVINHRPRGSLAPDVASVGLDLRLSRPGPAPRLGQLVNALSAQGPGPSALCDAQPQGSLAPGDLRVLTSAGTPPGGYDAAQAVAQGFDVACGRPSDPAFRAAVDPAAAVGSSPSGSGTLPPGKTPPPGGSSPPTSAPPYRCPPPCGPTTQARSAAYACPEAARPAYACRAPAGA